MNEYFTNIIMPHTLLQRFREQWKTAAQANGATALLALSGGRDSMVMAHLFCQAGIPFAVAHCNFGLRGREADLDEQLVRDWCAQNNIVCHTTLFDTKQRSAEWKTGTQETARILRYEWFEQIRKENGYARIVTAHHANDNVETLLINLFRGTGISGLHGIRPQHGHIVRPLLFAGRQEITDYAAENGIPFREDTSNAEDDYLRNAVRHHIIPVVNEWFPGAVGHINESISRFAEAEVLYKKAIAREKKKLLEQRGQDYYIPILKLRLSPVITTLCYELLRPFGFSAHQVPHILQLLHAESGKYVISSSHRVIRNRDFLIITTLPSEAADLIVIEGAPATVTTGRCHFSFSIEDKPEKVPAGKDRAYIDLDNITFPILLRKWRTGDYMYPLGMKMKKKKVGRLLMDEKMPLHEKEHVWILECQKRIAWVAGLRLDERFKVKDLTQKVLVIKRSAR